MMIQLYEHLSQFSVNRKQARAAESSAAIQVNSVKVNKTIKLELVIEV